MRSIAFPLFTNSRLLSRHAISTVLSGRISIFDSIFAARTQRTENFSPLISSLMHLSLEPGIQTDRFASGYKYSPHLRTLTLDQREDCEKQEEILPGDDILEQKIFPHRGRDESSSFLPSPDFPLPPCFYFFVVPTGVRSISLYRRIITSLDINHPIVIVPRVSRRKNRVRDVCSKATRRKRRGGEGGGCRNERAHTRTRSIATIAEIATDSKSLVHSTLILATRRVPSQKKKQRMDR